MRFTYLVALFASFSLNAQVLSGDALRLRSQALPAKCVVGELRFNASTSQFAGCTASNTWGAVGAGADRGLTNLTATSITVSLVPSGSSLNLGQAGSNFWNQIIGNTLRDSDGGLSYDIGARQISNGNVTVFDAASNAKIKVLGDNTGSGAIQLNKFNNTASVSLQANDSLTADITFVLPATDGTANQVLATNGSGVLSFITPASNSTIATLYTSKIVDTGSNSTVDFSSGGVVIDSNGDVNINANVSGIVNYGSNRFRLFSVGGTTAPMIEFREVGAENYVGLRGPNSMASDYVWILPGADGAGYVKSDGSGNLTTSAVAFSDLSGTASIAQGGTNNGALSTTAGGVLYMDGSKVMNITAGSAGHMLRSGGAGAPTWGNRVCRFEFGGGSANTKCTAASCTVRNSNDSCVSSVTRASAGTYVANFAASYFASTPVCICNAHSYGVANSFCSLNTPANASISMTVLDAATPTVQDAGVQVICIGD